MKNGRRHSESGFALAALIFFLTAASILIAVTVPSYQMQAKRAQEEELIFRGEEYMRAIQKFQRKFGVYPPSIEALSESNGMRFLRKPYTDPITGKPFRLIYINPDGSVSGSKMLNPMSNDLSKGLGGGLKGFTPPTGGGTVGGTSGGTTGGTPRGTTGGATGGATGGTPRGTTGGTTGISGTNPSGGTAGAAGIIGVASDSELESVKIYNSRQHYNEWEFIAMLQPTPGQPPAGQPPAGQPPAGQPPFGQPPPGQPRSGTGTSGFGSGTGMPGFGPPVLPGSPARSGGGQQPGPGLPGLPTMFGTGGVSQPQQPIKRPPE